MNTITNYMKTHNDEAVKVMTNIEEDHGTIGSLNKNTDLAIKIMTDSVENSSNSIVNASEKMKESVERSIDEVTDKIEQGFRDSLKISINYKIKSQKIWKKISFKWMMH